ncbi:hypothetical protein COCNU_scaffold001452G000010 [Cocos nucifera]|nr:hypothetical protein [Cocos nucifera]
MPKVVDRMANLEPRLLIWGSLRTLLKSGHQMLAHIKRAHHLEAKKTVEIRSLQGALRKEEFISTKLKAALALEEERKKEGELEARMAKSILEAMIRAVEEFKASFEMRNLNFEFGQQAFIKGFELFEHQVGLKISRAWPKFFGRRGGYGGGSQTIRYCSRSFSHRSDRRTFQTC